MKPILSRAHSYSKPSLSKLDLRHINRKMAARFPNEEEDNVSLELNSDDDAIVADWAEAVEAQDGQPAHPPPAAVPPPFVGPPAAPPNAPPPVISADRRFVRALTKAEEEILRSLVNGGYWPDPRKCTEMAEIAISSSSVMSDSYLSFPPSDALPPTGFPTRAPPSQAECRDLARELERHLTLSLAVILGRKRGGVHNSYHNYESKKGNAEWMVSHPVDFFFFFLLCLEESV